VITASVDGHLKFWKKAKSSVEFMKHFRAHLEPFQGLSVSKDGLLLATISTDKACKIFDVVNFGRPIPAFLRPSPKTHSPTLPISDMISMMKLDYTPKCCTWIFKRGEAQALLAV